MKTVNFIFISIFSICLGAQLSAQTNRASEFARKSFDLKKPDTLRMKVQLQLIARGAAGSKRVRNVELLRKNEQGFAQNFIEFISPQDVAGTKFLSRDQKDSKVTETLMFTPADKKIRAITGSSKKNAFMGTDLSYYDLENHRFEDFDYEMAGSSQKIKDKSFAGRSFHVVKAIPKDRSAPYDAMHYWIDEQSFQARRIEGFVQGVKVKDIYILQNLDDAEYLIPKTLLAINLQKNGHRTVWQVVNWEVNPPLATRIFSAQNLK